MKEKEELLRKIKAENIVWMIYLFLIGFSFYTNYLEQKYILYNDLEAKEKYRTGNILIFSIALIVYFYFFEDNIKDVENLSFYDSPSKKFWNQLNLVASTLIVIAGIIFLIIAIFDIELDTEIAFS